mmetsp:Transcript_50544/g.157820  ORF Transcript_50544/g.157820 Transcript_50544/m.157820 type:complete len:93 (-) Transcript_50544:255-533(-)
MIFWFIGMGCEPFEGVGAEVLSQWIASQGKRPPLEEIAMRLGEEFGSLINRCWDGEPELRPSADQVSGTWKRRVDGARKSFNACERLWKSLN